MVPNVIHQMEVVRVQKVGKGNTVRIVFVPIICTAKIVNRPVNVIKIQPKVAIHLRGNVIAMPAGVVICVIDHAHS